MESENVFFHPLETEAIYLEDYEEIAQPSEEPYPLRGQTHKFLQPEQFTYLDFPLTFIAFSIEMDDEDEAKVQSVLMYLEEATKVLSALEQTFGQPDLNLELKGEGTDQAGNVHPGSYSSKTWIQGGHRLTYALLPAHGKADTSAYLAQIFIQ